WHFPDTTFEYTTCVTEKEHIVMKLGCRNIRNIICFFSGHTRDSFSATFLYFKGFTRDLLDISFFSKYHYDFFILNKHFICNFTWFCFYHLCSSVISVFFLELKKLFFNDIEDLEYILQKLFKIFNKFAELGKLF